MRWKNGPHVLLERYAATLLTVPTYKVHVGH